MSTARQIVVVEDEAAIAETIVYALETEGFVAHVATTAGEGEALVASKNPDLVILDVGLPDDNGFEVCRRVRSASDVPIIFLTARAQEVDRIVGLELGADDYVVKPFSPRELTARVRAILRRGRATREEASAGQAHGPFAHDPTRREIRYHGQALDLSRYEYGLLELLLGSPGRVYTRDELMDHVWEAPEASFDRTVDTHIKTLRGKLRAAHKGQDPIRTHRGVGYSMRDPL